jgi:hypothetical protein
MASEQTILKILSDALTLYSTQDLPPERVVALRTLWLKLLKDKDDDELERAAETYFKSNAQWRPTPGQLLSLCTGKLKWFPDGGFE